jgi:hypothetical protein
MKSPFELESAARGLRVTLPGKRSADFPVVAGAIGRAAFWSVVSLVESQGVNQHLPLCNFQRELHQNEVERIVYAMKAPQLSLSYLPEQRQG